MKSLVAGLAILAASTDLFVGPAMSQEELRKVETVATFNDAMLTGVTVSAKGRIFVNYPRWGDDVPFTVAEVVNGKAVAYPNAEINKQDNSKPAVSLISVQSVVVDPKDRLWLVDTAAPGFSKPVDGGAKLVAVDLDTNKVIKTIIFPADVILPTTYVNDIRFDLTKGAEGVAYLTDSSLTGPGGIIIVDLATGKAKRRLSGDISTSPEKGFVATVDGVKLMSRPKPGVEEPLYIASDGIAISHDGKTLYYSSVSGRHLYSISTEALADDSISEEKLSGMVKDLGLKGASDGLESDDKGRVYGGDYENRRIRMLDDGKWHTIAEDKEIRWPDTLSLANDGYLYFTVNQVNRQPGFNEGKDLREKPYKLLRIKVDAGPVLLK